MTHQLSLQAVLRSYLERILLGASEDSKWGRVSSPSSSAINLQQQRSVLILDADTVRIVSTVMSQRDVLRLGVALVERIDEDDGLLESSSSSSVSPSSIYSSLTAVYFIRPTKSNIRRLRQELKNPRFDGYRVYFTNVMSDLRLQDLAEGDGRERVEVVREVYGDFVALDAFHFVVGKGGGSLGGGDFGAVGEVVDRCTEGLAAVMLSLRRNFKVRFSRSSELAGRVARSLCQLTGVEQRELFDFGERESASNSTVLVLDRREDPVTPLLSQWTYQAMVHELLGGLEDNVVRLRENGQEYVMSALDDEFFRKNMYLNFGDAGMAVKDLVDRVSADHKTVKGFDTIEDIAAFVEHLPEATEQQGLTAKHVAIMGALSKEVEERSLMAVSGVEQDVCCQASSPAAHYEAVAGIVRNGRVRAVDKARLVLLYAFRYEQEAPREVSSLFSSMETASGSDATLMETMRYLRKNTAAVMARGSLDLFSDKTLTSRFANLAKQHLRGVENVYTQHQPAFASVIERAVRGRLSAEDYPFASSEGRGFGGGYVANGTGSGHMGSSTATSGAGGTGTATGMGAGAANSAHQRSSKMIIAFIIGGTTYEEAKAVTEMNAEGQVNVYLGGTEVVYVLGLTRFVCLYLVGCSIHLVPSYSRSVAHSHSLSHHHLVIRIETFQLVQFVSSRSIARQSLLLGPHVIATTTSMYRRHHDSGRRIRVVTPGGI